MVSTQPEGVKTVLSMVTICRFVTVEETGYLINRCSDYNYIMYANA